MFWLWWGACNSSCSPQSLCSTILAERTRTMMQLAILFGATSSAIWAECNIFRSLEYSLPYSFCHSALRRSGRSSSRLRRAAPAIHQGSVCKTSRRSRIDFRHNISHFIYSHCVSACRPPRTNPQAICLYRFYGISRCGSVLFRCHIPKQVLPERLCIYLSGFCNHISALSGTSFRRAQSGDTMEHQTSRNRAKDSGLRRDNMHVHSVIRSIESSTKTSELGIIPMLSLS